MRKATQMRPACSNKQVKLDAEAYESRLVTLASRSSID